VAETAAAATVVVAAVALAAAVVVVVVVVGTAIAANADPAGMTANQGGKKVRTACSSGRLIAKKLKAQVANEAMTFVAACAFLFVNRPLPQAVLDYFLASGINFSVSR
jgi:hypothetical protein